MRVAIFPGDDGGCGWYRLRFPANAARAAGLDVVEKTSYGPVVKSRSGKAMRRDGTMVNVGDRAIRFAEEPDYDVAVLQRPFDIADAMVIPVMHAHGIAVVVDMDDDASALPPGHLAFQQMHPDHERHHPDTPNLSWVNAEMACSMADVVTVSTPRLKARYGAHSPAIVLRNCIPAEYLDVSWRKGDHVVGWTGAPSVHIGDLDVPRGGVRAGMPESWRFRAVAASMIDFDHRDEVHRRLGIREFQREVVPWVELRDGYPEMVARLDVGIAPLAGNHFNRCKSALRGLEYAALGVPFVASPTDEFELLAAMGIGRLARKPVHWIRHLRELCENDARRLEDAERARAVVADFTYERNAHHWIEAWRLARQLADRAQGKPSIVGS